MAKFNEVQKWRRAAIAERKRAVHGDPLTRKLKQKPQPLSLSGKRKRKLFKQWRREQKEALEKGLITMHDVEMAVADGQVGTSGVPTKPASVKFHMKKGSRLKVKQLKKEGKNKRKMVREATNAPTDAMVE